ncbi:YitT family protein [Streptococcus pacificus]|uniref:YitT family protein n=1 Tax=Streptococcus pacificus TaxID=2740577 RepID=A0ABS0ZK10_9STRE|nr:YitT family protein [Streptococcus pacificus]MBJ8326297.1 YitT family protein [Streptococcus pacificus]
MKQKYVFHPKNFFFITLGTAIYAFGFVNLNMQNKIAEGGLAGLTLVFHHLFNINPSYSGYLLNLPLVLWGAYIFGKRAMAYTVYGISTMYLFVYIFQKIPLNLDLQHDYLVISLIAGIGAGLGSGIVFRYGGTTGGSDIIARIIEDKFGIQLSQALLGFDIFVMLLSLTYVSVPRMMYALIASFMFSQVVHLVENGGYSVRGMFIISDKSTEIAKFIIEEIGRGVTYLQGEGAYSGHEKKVIYVAMSPTEIRDVKKVMEEIDPRAFISIMNIEEVVSPDFIVNRRPMLKLPKK